MTWKILVIGAVLGLSVMFFFGLGVNPREIPSPLIGKQAPHFVGKTTDGQPFDSKSLAGKVYLVSFWATWCTTCKADEPLIQSLGDQFKGETDFQIIGIATQDSLDLVQKYLGKGTRPYTNLFDDKGRLGIDWGMYGVPETFLVDRKGNIIDKVVGPINPMKLKQQVAELLAAGKPG